MSDLPETADVVIVGGGSAGSARQTASAPAPGGPGWDNAAAESFFGALKNEMYYRQSFLTRARARFAVADYIEVFYNRRRLHSALGYRTPPRHSLTTSPQRPPHDQQPEKLSKIVDTAKSVPS
jgi:transposase InsO family protein